MLHGAVGLETGYPLDCVTGDYLGITNSALQKSRSTLGELPIWTSQRGRLLGWQENYIVISITYEFAVLF